MSDRTIDFVVVDWKTPELAERAVETLDQNAGVPCTVTLIDAARHGLSYSQAIHRGAEECSGEILCALNADVECLDSQQPIIDLFESHPEVAVLGPRQVDQYGIVRHAGIVGTNTRPEHRFWGNELDMVEDQCREELLDVVTVSGSVYFARRSVWDELGGFLETPFYFEETAFSYRVRHEGYRVCFSGLSTWLHHWGSSPVPDEWKQEKFRESQALFRAYCDSYGIEHD